MPEIYENDTRENKKPLKYLFIFLKAFFNYGRPRVLISLSLMLFLGLIEGISIFMIVPLLAIIGLFDTGGAADTGEIDPIAFFANLFDGYDLTTKLLLVLLIYISVLMTYGMLNRYQSILNINLQMGFTNFLANKIHRLVTYAQWQFVAGKRQSDISYMLLSEASRVGGGTLNLMQLSITVITIIIQLAIAFIISAPLTLLVLGCGIVLFLVLIPVLSRIRKTGESIIGNSRGLYAQVSDNLGSLKEVKSYCAEESHINQFEELKEKLKNNMVSFTKINSLTALYYKAAAALAISVFLYFAVIVYGSGAGELLLLLLIFSRLWPKFSSLQSSLQSFYLLIPSYKNIIEFENECLEYSEKTENVRKQSIQLKESIKFRGVSFKYLKDSRDNIIDNINIDIPAFSTVAIAGASGAGKSTLVDLLLGLLTPEKGEVLIDSETLSEDNYYAWRQMVGYVPQKPYLFNKSIRENLLWARNDADEEELWDALRMASADTFVRNLPDGVNTLIGDRGVRLSAGEGQRIVLARVLLKKPAVLVLDEATSSLDMKNEEMVFRAIAALHNKLTIIILTHRIMALKNVDNIIVIANGQIVETGDYETLARKMDGHFKSLLAAGSGGAETLEDDYVGM